MGLDEPRTGERGEDGPSCSSVISSPSSSNAASSSSADGMTVRDNGADRERDGTDRECQCFVRVCVVTW